MGEGIQVAIEGQGAEEALAEFISIPGIRGRVEPAPAGGATRDGGVLVAVGAVVAIVVGVVEVADKVIAWREKWVKSHSGPRLNVIIEDARGNRLPLDDATPEQIATALATLATLAR